MNRAGWALILSALLAPSLFAQAAITNRPDIIAGGGGAQSRLLTTNLSVLAQPIAGEKSEALTLVNYSGFLGMFGSGLLAPTNVFATTTNLNAIIVSWNSVTGASGYEVRRTNAPNATTNWIVSATNNYTDTSAFHNTNYYYQVRAREEFNVSLFSGVALGHRRCAPPTNVAASKAEFTNKVTITWNAADGASHYLVYRNTSNDAPSSGSLSANVPVPNYDDSTAVPGIEYWYFVRAANNVSTSDYSTGTNGWRALSSPEDVQASDGAFLDKVRVTWTLNTNATGYAVWRGASADTNTAALIGASAALLHDDPTAIPGTLYYYWVQATNALTVSALGAADSGYRALSAPGGVQASDGAFLDKVQVTWTVHTNATGYALWRGASADTNTAALIGASAALLYDDPTAIPGTLYYYWVQATNVVTVSGLSAADSGYRGLSAPADVQASDGAFLDKVRVTWTVNTNATSYQVWWNTVGDTNTATRFTTEPTGITYDDFTAAPGTNYYYWVKAQNSISTSDFSAPDTGYLQLAVPTGVTATKGVFTHKITVAWNVVTGANSYVIQRAGPSWDALYDQTDSPPYDDINAAIGTKYDYTVKAKNGNATSAASDPDTGWRRSVFADYDGDGKSDPALLNKSSGVFRFYSSAGGYAPFNVNMAYASLAPTATTTIPYDPVAGDYDGNGKSDPATYQQASAANSSGFWRIFLAYSGYAKIISRNFGGAGIKPLSGDYDRDGTNDFVIYKTNQPSWLTFSLSSYNYTPDTALPLTENGWIPVAGDYDGDGYTDPALYIPASGRFVAFLSAAGWNETNLLDIGPGFADYIPVAGDYDGNGVFDPCLYSPSLGLLGALLSSDGHLELWSFGAPPADCLPVGGDYDGDGLTDPMIYGEAQGYWAVFLSSDTNQSLLAVSGWGGEGWAPVR